MGLGQDETAAQAAVRQLQEQAERARQMEPYTSSYQQYREPFHDFMQSRQEFEEWRKSRQPQTKQEPWYHSLGEVYRAPEWNPQWLSMVEQTPEGRIVSKPGFPADIGIKAEAYAHYRREVRDKLETNPAEFIAPIAQHVAQQVAAQVMQQQFGQQQEVSSLSSFRQQNANWLYENEGGQFKTRQHYEPRTGRMEEMPVLSKKGQRFIELVMQRDSYQKQRGMNLDYADQLHWAQMALSNELYQQQQTQTPAQPQTPAPTDTPQATAREEANENWLKTNSNGHRANGAAAVSHGAAVLDFGAELAAGFNAAKKRF